MQLDLKLQLLIVSCSTHLIGCNAGRILYLSCLLATDVSSKRYCDFSTSVPADENRRLEPRGLDLFTGNIFSFKADRLDLFY